jgi:hypothetical protein
MTKIFTLSVKNVDEDEFKTTGLFLGTDGASADDYMSFVGGVIAKIRGYAHDDLEVQANASGRTLLSGLSGVGSVSHQEWQ